MFPCLFCWVFAGEVGAVRWGQWVAGARMKRVRRKKAKMKGARVIGLRMKGVRMIWTTMKDDVGEDDES